MDQFNDSNPPVQHTQSYTLGQPPDTSEQGLSTFNFTPYLQTQYDPPKDSTTSTFNQAGPSNAGLNNSLCNADLNNCSQSSLSLYDHDPVNFQSAWVGIFNCMGQGLWETPGYRTTQTSGGYLELLPGDTTDTFGDFVIHQPKPIPALAIQPLSNYNVLLVAADYSLYNPLYVTSGSSEGLAGYLVDVDGSISKFFVWCFTFRLLVTNEKYLFKGIQHKILVLGHDMGQSEWHMATVL